ncbi:hypothetical protein BGW80DRAFT_1456320 [Lactifluus volemus]|nr:hypothetical protein BGW80DRAFT_1456320 [Lactifluus volemus]
MPFANLPSNEKDAFFSLLDEYFASRPDLLSRVGGGQSPATSIEGVPQAAVIATAAQRALANPAASRALATGFQRASNSLSGNDNGPSATTTSNPSNADHAAPAVNVGRVAAAAQAFSAAASPTPLLPRQAKPPVPAPAHKRTDSSGLVPQKKFGDVDVSSAGAMYRTLRGSTAAKNAPPAPVHAPSAFSAKKSGFAPPPVRRVSASASPVQVEPEPEPEFQPEGGEEAEAAGQWAEALYDYTSEESGDLHLRAGERVLVTEQTSSDWWTGEIDRRSGLFPASYVKLL